MTLDNWKELSINGIKLKRLVRASDGLVLFELPSGPDYSEPFWIEGTYKQAGTHSQFVFAAADDPTPLNLEYSEDKKSWMPLEFYYDTSHTDWESRKQFSSRSEKTWFRSSSETPVNPRDYQLRIQSYYYSASYKPIIIGGNLHSFICKDFKDIVDLSGMLSCFNNFLAYSALADARNLLMPAKVIGDYGYAKLFYNSSNYYSTLSATPKMSFDVEEIGYYGMSQAFCRCRAFNGSLAFPNLKSVGQYGMYQIGYDSGLSSIEFPDNQISVDNYGMYQFAANCPDLKEINKINVRGLGSYSLTRAFYQDTALERVGGISAGFATNALYPLSGAFCSCVNLVDVGDLNIKAVGSQALKLAFADCYSLSSVRGNIDIVGENAFVGGFKNCTSLEDVSNLSITLKPANYVGRYLFQGCSALQNMPTFTEDSTLTAIANFKLAYAFDGCTSLKHVTPLPALKSSIAMYAYAFRNCTSMTDAPEIMLSSLNSTNCMTYMFDGCTSLSSVTVHFTSWPSTVRTTNWLRGVSPTGIFRCPAELEDKRGVNFIPEGWTKVDL